MKNSQYTVAYAAGPGDVIGSYRHWLSGRSDPNEVSETYSGQFFQQIKDLDLTALVIASHARAELLVDDRFVIEHRPMSSQGKRGLAYHLSDIRYWLGIMISIKNHGCSVAIISSMEHWWLLSFLRISGVKVVPTLHCTFWPKGYRPQGLKDRLIQTLNGWFWRKVPAATICVSLECQRQIEEISNYQVSGVVLQGLAKYRPEYFSKMSSSMWSNTPFRLLFAGRIEINKGILDLVAVMKKLTTNIQIEVVLEVCGDGSAVNMLKQQIYQAGLDSSIKLLGKLSQAEMFTAFQRCHAVIVPTTVDFAEGFNQVVAESVLAGRPVIATSVCPANEIFPRSVIEVSPGDVDQMANEIARLASDSSWYDSVRSYSHQEASPLYDSAQSFGAAVKLAIRHAIT